MKRDHPVPQRPRAALAAALLLWAVTARAQETKQEGPAGALAAAMVAACRQNETEFARYLTTENAATFLKLTASQRVALMKRFSLLDDPGRPLLSSDPEGRAVLRCETPAVTTEMRLGATRLEENLAFIPVQVRVPEDTRGTPAGSAGSRRAEFGMVREGGNWKLLSVGLLLLNLRELSQQWATSELEANEREAMAALRKIADEIGTYRRAFGKLPETLAQLGPAPKEGISPDAAGLLDAELAAGKKGGYEFRYQAVQPQGTEPGFELGAKPAEYGKTGLRSFFLDSSGTLRGGDKHGALATASDPLIESR